LKDVFKTDSSDRIETLLDDLVTEYQTNRDEYQRGLINKKIQKSYYFMQLMKAKRSGLGVIYLSYFYDWRGRFYSYSGLDPLNNKYFRPFYKLNSNLDLDDLRGSNYFKCLNSLKTRLDNDPILDYFMKIIYLEIGKLYKTRLINEGGVTIEDFIECGRRKLSVVLDNSEDELYRFSLEEGLACLERTGDMPNITIIRDATASSFQHWGVELGVRSKFLDILNLDG